VASFPPPFSSTTVALYSCSDKKFKLHQLQVSENESYRSISHVSETLELIQPTKLLFSVEIFSVVGELGSRHSFFKKPIRLQILVEKIFSFLY
jgi:hypothetical protein